MKCCHSCMLFQVHLLDQQLHALLRNLLTEKYLVYTIPFCKTET